ncbi:flagellin [Paraburkholderia fungorum]|uniref:flagellin N-terminal helical domain-containing protein n=1 Tax=Paraburkholderia fungorum TaxID=134537 RepID=UPI0038BC8C34
MTTVINTNIASQIAQNNLLNNQAAVTSAITQLSSGLAINSAADNPAGLAIATTLQAQINGQTVAQQNANNGISLAQTGQSALTQITNNLQTIRQLAVQASNASNTAANRAALNQEVQQSLAQINTIATTTSFNGQNLLDGSFGSQNFQIGANAGQTIAVNLSQGTQTSQIGQTSSTTFSLNGTNGGLSTEGLNVSVGGAASVTVGNAVAGTGAGQTADSAFAAAAAVNNSNISGLTATANNSQQFVYTGVTNGAAATASENYNLSINGTNIFGSTGLSVGVGQTVTATTVISAINAQSGTTGVTATLGSDGKTFTLNAADGSNVLVTQSTTGANITGGLANNAGSNILINGQAGSLANLSGASSFSSGQLRGSVTLASASGVQLSGAAATDISSQYDNSTNGADSLQAVQTTTSSTSFAAGTNGGTINFYVGASSSAATTPVPITVGVTDTSTTIAQSINSNLTLQQAGISASVNSKGALVVTNKSGQNLAITDTNTGTGTGFNSGLDNAEVVTGSAAYTAPTAATTNTMTFTVGSATYTQTLTNATTGPNAGATVNDAAASINANSALKAAGISATINGTKLVIINTSGQTVTEADSGGGAFVTGLAGGATTGAFESAANSTNYTATATGSLSSIDVLTVADAQKTIQSVDAALSQISTLQGQLGAVQNRFTSVISNLSSSVQNAQSTQSSIQDTNYASETSALSRAQVLSQAAQAMVAQANQLPQQVLKLLQ